MINIRTFSQVQQIPNLAYQIYQTLQIYWVYEKDYIKYKYDRKWKTENVAEKHNSSVKCWKACVHANFTMLFPYIKKTS